MTDEEFDAKFLAQAAIVLPSTKADAILRVCRDVAGLSHFVATIAATLH